MTNTVHKNPISNNNQKSNKATTITAVITVGVVALAAVWVIAQSDCGAKLNFRIWPYPDIRLEKLTCPAK